jgi:organic hydroperoxide reductase OsmC/OhrA
VGAHHRYQTTVRWTGNLGSGTSSYREYGRNHVIESPAKPIIPCSAGPEFRGDASRYNPEELLVASLSACHMLWYLHLCADAGIVVEDYVDRAEGIMETAHDGSGKFTQVTLRPHVTIGKGDPNLALRLHDKAHEMCFIASSVRFPVTTEPTLASRGPEKP